ncbi:hypothetical protein BOX15_Mlig010629g1 [Macrostomum lignano]|uniref:Neurotransmitter-gated ion-channel ligand-binding domain-containing protein n=1 Tax=Macrostomum lignano TaxID=282301 RepID=A0A267F0H1_9PLAT|nr:hypothetical protein BOX15_Mlig010629g1 [Macrostomum lignano]
MNFSRSMLAYGKTPKRSGSGYGRPKRQLPTSTSYYDAGYHAVDTDDDCQSNGSGEFNSTEFLNARDEPEDPQLLQQQPQQLHYRRQPAPAQAACRGLRNRGLLRAASSSAATAEAALSDRDAVVTTSLSERAGPSGLCAATIGTVDPGPVSLDPTQRLIDALETLRDSINDSTSVALQQSRVRNRRRGTSAGQVNYKGGGLKNDERCRIRAEKVVVEIRVVFLKIGEIDTLKELYHADAFIQAKWKEPLLEGRGAEELKSIDLEKYWNPLLYIDNILSETKEATWVVAQHDPLNSDVYIVERRRIKGVFLETLELNDFPLDVQDLTITITSERPDTEIELIPDEAEMSGINIQTFVDQQEWRLHEHIEVEKRTLTQEFSSTMKSHPCLAVRCRAARRPGYFYWNVFLIMFMISGLSFATFAVEPHKCEYRLRLSFTLVLTSVTFKYVVAQSLPRISYLTYMDKYVLMSLAILCIVSIWHAVVTMIQPPNLGGSAGRVNQTHTGRDGELGADSWQSMRECFLQAESGEPCSRHLRRMEMVNKIEKDVFISFSVLYVLAHVIFIFWLYYDACRRRREMRKKDREYKDPVLPDGGKPRPRRQPQKLSWSRPGPAPASPASSPEEPQSADRWRQVTGCLLSLAASLSPPSPSRSALSQDNQCAKYKL